MFRKRNVFPTGKPKPGWQNSQWPGPWRPNRFADRSRAAGIPFVSYAYVKFSTDERSCIALLTDFPTVTRGYPVIREVERPRQPNGKLRRTLTIPETLEPFEITLPLLFDGFTERRSMEGPIRALELLAAPTNGKPRAVQVDGPVPHVERIKLWWISGIEWGEAITNQGERIRQAVTVTIMEREKGELAIDTGVGSRGGTVTIKKGEDSFKEVARRLKRKRKIEVTAKELARANAMSVGTKLKPGMELRLPR